MGRCLSPCLGDLDPNLYRDRLDEALRLFEVDGASALLAHVDAQMRAASAAERFERAAWLRRRARRLESLLNRLGGVLRAAHAGARLVVVPHPAAPARADAFWIIGGRIADWGPLPPETEELAARTDTALAAAPARSLGGWLPADELDETRIVGMWIAGHDEARVLELDPPPDARALAAFSASPKDDRPRRARRAAPSARAREPALGS
jgi:DNA polymerase-3 subunit epsilon